MLHKHQVYLQAFIYENIKISKMSKIFDIENTYVIRLVW